LAVSSRSIPYGHFDPIELSPLRNGVLGVDRDDLPPVSAVGYRFVPLSSADPAVANSGSTDRLRGTRVVLADHDRPNDCHCAFYLDSWVLSLQAKSNLLVNIHIGFSILPAAVPGGSITFVFNTPDGNRYPWDSDILLSVGCPRRLGVLIPFVRGIRKFNRRVFTANCESGATPNILYNPLRVF